MNSLHTELITKEISRWLFIIDKQILRWVNKYFCNLFPYEIIFLNSTEIELVHLIRYKKFLIHPRCPYTVHSAVINGNVDCAFSVYFRKWSSLEPVSFL